MANRLPLTTNKEKKRIEELPVGDYLDLSQSGIVSAISIESKNFYGNLVGIASTATYLINADGILEGIVPRARLDGTYDIDITGTADSLITAENILAGIINPSRLSGTYDINITGTATTSRDVIGGIGSVTELSVSGITTLSSLNVSNINASGIITASNFVGNFTGIADTSTSIIINDTNQNLIYYPTFVANTGAQELNIDLDHSLSYNPSTKRLGINTDNPTTTLDVVGDVTAEQYYGDGINLVGIVTQIIPSIGINIKSTQNPGKGVVTIDAYRPIGKTIFVAQTGDDTNTGLTENYPKRTIKSAAAIALYGDTIKVFPGVYQEENPITLAKTVSVQGTELRNIVITPKYPELDLFYVNNGCHITNASFIGPEMTNGSAIVSLQPLLGVSTDRYFDAARMIRMNLDYIANESVGFLTSGFSGFAGNHREQDAARLIDLNIDFIAAESIGFLTSTDYKSPAFEVPTVPGDCEDDIKDILRSISYDLKAGSNRKVIGAGLTYYDNAGALQHITGVDVNGYSVREATVAAINYAVGITTYVINNADYAVAPGITTYSGLAQDFSYSPVIVSGGCTETVNKINTLSGIVTSIVGLGTESAPLEVYGVNLESNTCATDVKRVWKCIIHDITRGGNSRSYAAGAAYYDNDWNLIPQILKNPDEVQQTIETLNYSFNIARSVVNNCTWGGYPSGISTDVIDAQYDNITGIVTITATNHGLNLNDPVKVVGLGFTCPSGIATLTYPTGNFGYIFPVKSVIGVDIFEVVVGQSTLPHTYVSGGTVQKYQNFQDSVTQVKDLSIQVDSETGYNNSINSCSDVISAIHSCVGVVTTIIGLGSSSGITSRYPGNSGVGFTSIVGITSAIYYDKTDDENQLLQGFVRLEAPGLNVKLGDRIELRDLLFECESSGSGISTQKFPSGQYGYEFYVNNINEDSTFDVFVGISTIPHTYVGEGIIVDRSVNVTAATYDNVTGITTITAPGAYVRTGDVIRIRDLEFSCMSGAGTTTIYPTGSDGYEFRVKEVQTLGNSFTIQVGPSTIPHTYVSGGVVFPTYSKGVGPITQGPYVRNCTNFIPKSIGMKVDGFAAEPGEADDIGVTGTMSVDSYTQYNQGGIGVSITNGGYAQLVSIFTICDDIAIFTGSGGQCDLTNSNSSFGNYGLYSSGVGDNTTKSIYRYTGTVANTVRYEDVLNDRLVISGVGLNRPYDGQSIYFDELYYGVDQIKVTNGGSGYSETNPPEVIVEFPTGPNGIKAEASANVVNGKVVSVDIISNGNQYRTAPNIEFIGGGGVGADADAIMYPLYYNIESATEPVEGVSNVILTTPLNNTVSAGTIVYFSRLSLQIATTISFEWVGAGTNINTAKPALGGVTISDNEVVKEGGGQVIYTSTNQAGNFKIGDGVVINQLTGTISGRAYNQSVLSTVTPLIVALG